MVPFEIVVDKYKIPPMQAAVLRAVWDGRGMPVVTARILDAMYADDPEGGPEVKVMYGVFKTALCLLRKRLKGSGIGIETLEGRQGRYRLKIEGM